MASPKKKDVPEAAEDGEVEAPVSRRPPTIDRTSYPTALQALIPRHTGYVPRAMGKVDTDSGERILTDLDMLGINYVRWVNPHQGRQANILLDGPPGTGKTTLVEEHAARWRLPLVTVVPGTRSERAFGTWTQDPDTGRLRYVKGPMFLAVMCNLPVVLYLDEINRLHADIEPTLYPLTDYRRKLILPDHPVKFARRVTRTSLLGEAEEVWEYYESIHARTFPRKANGEPDYSQVEEWEGPLVMDVHPGTLIAASYNPNEISTRPLNAAIKDRFMCLTFEYDEATEAQFIDCAPVRLLAHHLRNDAKMRNSIRSHVTPRMQQDFLHMIPLVGWEAAVESFLARFNPPERNAIRELIKTSFEEGPNSIPNHFKLLGYDV